MDWYLFRLLLDSLVFLYLVFYCAGFSPCGFPMCGFATSGLSMCGYSPCGAKGKAPDLRSERRFPMWEYRNVASPSNAAYSERKCPKSTLILTVNRPVYPPFKAKKTACSTGRLTRLRWEAVWIFWLLAHCWFCVILYSRLSFKNFCNTVENIG